MEYCVIVIGPILSNFSFSFFLLKSLAETQRGLRHIAYTETGKPESNTFVAPARHIRRAPRGDLLQVIYDVEINLT